MNVAVQVTEVRNAEALSIGASGVFASVTTLYGFSQSRIPLTWWATLGILISTAIWVVVFLSWRMGTIRISEEQLEYRELMRWHMFSKESVLDVEVQEGRTRSPLVRTRRIGLILQDGRTHWMKSLDVQTSRSRLRDRIELDKQDRCVQLIHSWLGLTSPESVS